MAQYFRFPPSGGGSGPGSDVNIHDSSGNSLDSNGTGALMVDGSGAVQPVSGTVAATQSGTWNLNNISGTVSLPTGASTAAKQPALGTAGSPSADVISIQGVVSGTVVPVSAAALPLPSGAATAANQATEIASLSSIDGKLASLGQKNMAGSEPVVIASDQSAIPASQSGTWNINNVSGTVSLPTGASTSALQTTGNTSLSSIDGKLGSLGQKTMSGSAPVVIASDQSALPAAKGRSQANASVRKDYSAGSVTTGAWVQLVASTTSATNLIEIFDSSGQTMKIGTGAAASEVSQLYVFPGGNGPVSIAIPASTRVSVRAVSSTASVGELDINFWT